MSLASRLGLPPARTDNLRNPPPPAVDDQPKPPPIVSPFVRRALDGKLPASDRTGSTR